ncbi:FG-GAP repeat domain-containing protein [Rhodohalobacter sp. 8-1]|uniref:FG-GAP repeat domain-containing protein n=1 Tax=Rhodohalobacter sp. 8-1 TaxID=3131972 RepID=UPI0030EB6F89
MKKYIIYILPLALLFSFSCDSESGTPLLFETVWERDIQAIGTHSSPRPVDLNNDGISDLILGAGGLEMESTSIGILAVNGATGDTLWTLPARDQVFGSPTFLDITGNGKDDILINGRAGMLFAVEGETGSILWEFLPDVTFEEARDLGIYNFYNPQLIPDQDGDGIDDILIANGGDYTIPPYEENRPAGKLMVINSSNGHIIAEATVPDGKETYMSAVVSQLSESDTTHSVFFGTGGETIGGSLYVTTLNDVLKGDLSSSLQLAVGESKGFIAPPVLADINGDGYLDIIANAVDGRTLAINGEDFTPMWDVEIDNTENYGSLAVGRFTDSSRLDIFTSYTIGIWPNLRDNLHLLINGRTGEVLSRDTLGVFQTASPIAADLTGNGYEDAVLSVNIGYEQFDGSYHYNHMLVGQDFKIGHQFSIDELRPGANLSSTPWIGDLDGNGYLDIVYAVSTNEKNIFGVSSLSLIRLQAISQSDTETKWGSYMGSDFDGIFD